MRSTVSRLLLLTSLLAFWPAQALTLAQANPAGCTLTEAESAQMQAAFTRLVEAGVIRLPGPEVQVDPPPGSMDPTQSRAQFAALLVRMLGWEEAARTRSHGPPSFPDLQEHWAAGAIELLRVEGIVKGYPDGLFRPDEPITLVEAKLLLARLLRLGPDLAPAQVDPALTAAGLDLTLPCPTLPVATAGQLFLLLDQARSLYHPIR